MRRIEAQLFEARQRPRVLQRIAEHRHGDVIAAVLALHANALRDPPDGRVIEKKRFHDGLNQVDDEVVPPDMGELVRQNHLDLLRGQARETGDRKEDDGTKPADDRRHFDCRGLQDSGRATQLESAGDPAQCPLPFDRGGLCVPGRHSIRSDPADDETRG